MMQDTKAMQTPRPLAMIAGLISWAAATSFAVGEVRTVLVSGNTGPTILLVNSPASGDLSRRDGHQTNLWLGSLQGQDRGHRGEDLAAAVRATSPAAVVMLAVEKAAKSDTRPATLFARGCDSATLLRKLNSILDKGTAPLHAAADACCSATRRARLRSTVFHRRSGCRRARRRTVCSAMPYTRFSQREA